MSALALLRHIRSIRSVIDDAVVDLRDDRCAVVARLIDQIADVVTDYFGSEMTAYLRCTRQLRMSVVRLSHGWILSGPVPSSIGQWDDGRWRTPSWLIHNMPPLDMPDEMVRYPSRQSDDIVDAHVRRGNLVHAAHEFGFAAALANREMARMLRVPDALLSQQQNERPLEFVQRLSGVRAGLLIYDDPIDPVELVRREAARMIERPMVRPSIPMFTSGGLIRRVDHGAVVWSLVSRSRPEIEARKAKRHAQKKARKKNRRNQ